MKGSIRGKRASHSARFHLINSFKRTVLIMDGNSEYVYAEKKRKKVTY